MDQPQGASVPFSELHLGQRFTLHPASAVLWSRCVGASAKRLDGLGGTVPFQDDTQVYPAMPMRQLLANLRRKPFDA